MSDKRPPTVVNSIDLLTENEGFFINQVLAGTLLEIKTRNGSTYTMVVSEPEQNEVVLVGPPETLSEPTLFRLQGSTAGGSMVRVGWVGKGLRLRLSGAGSLLTTSPVIDYREIDDLNRALDMLAEAEIQRPQPITDERIAEFERLIENVVTKPPTEHQDSSRAFVLEFNHEGQGMIVQILRVANEAGKLTKAFEMLYQHWNEHWAYRAPEIRGSFVTELDEQYIRLAYEEIGLPLFALNNLAVCETVP